jgi:hypothetical protein
LVDWIALLVSHSLIALAFWRLLWRADLDDEKAPDRKHRPAGFGQPGTTPDRPFAPPRAARPDDA